MGNEAMLLGDSRPLLAAKLLIPNLPATTVARSRLEDKLGSAPPVRLTTVVAAAGWGKTTLLSSWARDPAQQGRVGWLSLDEADDEPVRFWTYALSALHSVEPQLLGESLGALRAPGMDPVGVALAELLNASATSQDRYTLILDDFHLLQDDAIHQSMEFLLSYLPPSLQLIIAGRADPPLPLARMRVRGELQEVRVADLRCTTDEGAQVLAGGSGRSKMSSDATTRLVERTEGWPAGLHLAAITLRESEDPDAVAAELRGGDRHILDYFTSEVLPALTPAARDLLIRASILERLSGPLCDAVLGTSGAADILDDLHRDALFLSTVQGGWYRCHPLFREVLQRELETREPDQGSVVLSRAADWFLTHGQVEEAVALRQAAGDERGSLDLILNSDRWFLDRGASAALLRLGERLAASVSDPRLFVVLAVSAGQSGRTDRCAHWLTRAEPFIESDSQPLPGWRTLRAHADAFWASFPAANDAAAALTHARRAVALEDDPQLYGYAVARLALGGALRGAGQLDASLASLRDAWESPARRELPGLLLLQCAGLFAMVLIETGDLDGARAVCRDVHEVADAAERAWGQGAAAALAILRLSEARLTWATDPAAATPAYQRAAELAEGWGWSPVHLSALCGLAGSLWAAGDRAGARTTLDRAREVANSGQARPANVRELQDLESRLGRSASKTARVTGGLYEELTDRELAILRALRGPLTAREIGSEMFLSINTVKGYTKRLYRKLGVVTREDAVRRGHELGLI